MDDKLLNDIDDNDNDNVTVKSSKPTGRPLQANEFVIVEQPPESSSYGTARESHQLQWMQPPEFGHPDCPPGLEYLLQVDQLLIHQLIEVFEAFSGFETRNRFIVKNSMGQQVYYAAEKNNCLTMQFYGFNRPFEMFLTDNKQHQVMRISRPFGLGCRCFPCCLHELEIQAPPGTTIGYVKQLQTCIKREFNVLNAFRDPVVKIRGPCWLCACGNDLDFEILTVDSETVIGGITRAWPGLWKQAFTSADNFGIRFPADLDVGVKALLLGAVFLLDFMYFEGSRRRRRRY